MPEHALGLTHEQAHLSSFKENSTIDNAFTSLELLRDGMKLGFTNRAKEALSHPADTIGEFGCAAGIGMVLNIASRSGNAEMRMLGRAGAYFLTLGAAADFGKRIGVTTSAIKDAWNGPDQYQASKMAIANSLGAALFDYPLLAASGLGGSRLINRLYDLRTANLIEQMSSEGSARQKSFHQQTSELQAKLLADQKPLKTAEVQSGIPISAETRAAASVKLAVAKAMSEQRNAKPFQAVENVSPSAPEKLTGILSKNQIPLNAATRSVFSQADFAQRLQRLQIKPLNGTECLVKSEASWPYKMAPLAGALGIEEPSTRGVIHLHQILTYTIPEAQDLEKSKKAER